MVTATGVQASAAYWGASTWGRGVERRAMANAVLLLELEARLGVAVEAAVQGSWLGTGLVGTVLNLAYAALYWPFVATALVGSWLRDRDRFRLLRNALAVSGAVRVVVLVAVPVAPPRFLAGFEDSVADAGVASLAHPSGWFNPYAAMPSFHVCWTLLAGIALHRAGASRAVLLAPAGMMLAVITTGNHFVLDVVASAALALAAWVAAHPMQRAFDRAADRDRRRRVARGHP